MLTKSMIIDIWVLRTLNKLSTRDSYAEIRFSKIWKCFFVIRSFCTPYFVCLNLGFDRAVLYGSIVFSVLVNSTKKGYFSFLKKVFVFPKICLKIDIFKPFKIPSDSHIKTRQYFKRRAILNIPSTIFRRNLCSYCWL